LKKPIPFGKYYLLERINVGGMAEVFRAKAFGVEGFERLVAVKKILPNIAEDEEFIAMFIDEAKIAVQLQHANIAQIFDLGKVEDSFFIALEFVRGRDLRAMFDRVRQRGEGMPTPQACFIVMQVCEGLDYAHNKRDGQGQELHLVHRDISPQNVLVGFEGEIKLIDFGIAKAAGKASKTQAGILKGKFGYMSPEQVRGLPIDRRSDIFSVGIVLYELLTGERLFMGESDFSTLEKVRNVEILAPSSYNKSIPEELERIALKALAKDPEDRYQNAIDLHDDLQAFLYTKGELYSRKDLAAWMKKMFPAEIEEENTKAEQFRRIVAPGPSSPFGSGSLRKSSGGAGPGSFGQPGASASSGGTPRPQGAAKMTNNMTANRNSNGEEMGWDDEELDTQIFEKEPTAEPEVLDTRDIFEDDDDRTVANEPPPDVLRAATAPNLATPQPRVGGRSEYITPPSLRTPVPPSGGRGSGPPTGAPRTLFGMPAPNLALPAPPASSRPLGSTTPIGTPRRQTRSSPSFPASSPVPGSLFAPRSESFEISNTTPSSVRSSRAKVLALVGAAVLVLIGGVAGAYIWSVNRTGKVEVSAVPADVTILVDNVKVAEKSPFLLERPPGSYTVSVVRPGYARSDQSVEIRAGQTATLSVPMEAAADTGFELTSEPPGGLVWLDGNPMSGPDGQARTDFRAYRIPPGKHVLEIRGDSKRQPWREEVLVEPGLIKKVKATLILVGGVEPDRTQAAAGAGQTPGLAPRVAAGPTAGSPSRLMAPNNPGGAVVARAPTAGMASGRMDTGVGTPAQAIQRRRRLPRDTTDLDLGQGRVRAPVAAVEDTGGTAGDCAITVGTRPWSEIWIDGKNTGRHTPYSESIGCGKHKLTFKRPDLNLGRTENITVRSGEKFKQSFSLDPDSE
jgi:eukaryotic-like serine/threonine-protein kinase